jgi:hypothetical protein
VIHVGPRVAIEPAAVVTGSATGVPFIFAVIAPTDAVGNKVAQDVVVNDLRATRNPIESAVAGIRTAIIAEDLWLIAGRKTTKVRHPGLRARDIISREYVDVVWQRIRGKIAVVIYCRAGSEV